MTRRSRSGETACAAITVALLLVVATVASGGFVGVAAAAPGGSDAVTGDDGATGGSNDGGVEAPADRVDPPTQCFAGEGYPISIGDEGAAIEALVHLSVLTDPAAGNEFGMEAAGTLAGDPIVTLGAGVRLTAREAIANGVDPFAAFDVLYAYELRLPMFDGAIDDSEYRDDGSPIESSAGTVPC
ncbi:hypothetical protein FK85_23790 [Halorubrum saccharovorum]|uniref:Uncharacterized protein n=1 Tax=Halorubrum saccharovorum TaxID=2248 RepID=A0A0F8AVX0_9EURY|nr:hypothetical protein [Halorubrum saccharovorum]KKF40066.1 hypothetical protein FK85_23790 [Halorubrum saccharovorum]